MIREETIIDAEPVPASAGYSLTADEEELAISYAEGRLSAAEALLLLSAGYECEEHEPHGHPHEHHIPYDNLPGIEDEELLEKSERIFAFGKMYRLLSLPEVRVNGFGLNTMSRIHYALFSDLYPFAGRIRSEEARSQLAEVSKRLIALKYLKGLEAEELCRQLSWLQDTLLSIHPFLAGDENTIRTFLILLSRRAGWQIDFSTAPVKVLSYNGAQKVLVVRQDGPMGPIMKEEK